MKGLPLQIDRDTLQEVVAFLNVLLELDPYGIEQLLCTYVNTTTQIEQCPTIRTHPGDPVAKAPFQ